MVVLPQVYYTKTPTFRLQELNNRTRVYVFWPVSSANLHPLSLNYSLTSLVSVLPLSPLVACLVSLVREQHLLSLIHNSGTLIIPSSHCPSFSSYYLSAAMKAAAIAVLATAFGASAQSVSSLNQLLTPSLVTYVTYEECSSSTSSPPVVTEVVTTCTESSTRPPASSSVTPLPTIRTTSYTTTYKTICSTGLTDTVYTITQTYSGSTFARPTSTTPGYMPPGFTATVTVCDTCGINGGPATVTLTVPCETTTTPAPVPPTSGTIRPTTGASSSGLPVSPGPSSPDSPVPPGPSPSSSGTVNPIPSSPTTGADSRTGTISDVASTVVVTVCPGPGTTGTCTHKTISTTGGPAIPTPTTTLAVCPGGTVCVHPSGSTVPGASSSGLPAASSSRIPPVTDAAAALVGDGLGWRTVAGVVGAVLGGVLLL